MSAYATSVKFSRTADNHDVTTFGKTAKVYQSGLTDGTASLDGIYDNTASTGPAAVLRPMLGGVAVDLVFRPEGTATGRPTSTVAVIVTAYEETTPVADMVSWTATLQFSDVIANSTQ